MKRALFVALLAGQVFGQEESSNTIDSLRLQIQQLTGSQERLERVVDLLAHSQWDSAEVATLQSQAQESSSVSMDDQRSRKAKLNFLLKELKQKKVS